MRRLIIYYLHFADEDPKPRGQMPGTKSCRWHAVEPECKSRQSDQSACSWPLGLLQLNTELFAIDACYEIVA